jgi:hypothetical protein
VNCGSSRRAARDEQDGGQGEALDVQGAGDLELEDVDAEDLGRLAGVVVAVAVVGRRLAGGEGQEAGREPSKGEHAAS